MRTLVKSKKKPEIQNKYTETQSLCPEGNPVNTELTHAYFSRSLNARTQQGEGEEGKTSLSGYKQGQSDYHLHTQNTQYPVSSHTLSQ